MSGAEDVINQLIKYGFVRGRIDTGFALVDIWDTITAWSYRVSHFGLYISSSANENFVPGDRITGVNGQAIASLTDFNKAVEKFAIGDTIEVTIVRNGRSLNLPLTITECKGDSHVRNN